MPRLYSMEVPGSEDAAKGWGPIHRGVGTDSPSIGLRDPETGVLALTSWENFVYARKRFGELPYLGTRLVGPDGKVGDFVWSSYEEVGRRSEAFGSGLVNLNLCPPKEGDAELLGRGVLGFYSKNRAEWLIAEQGCYSQAVVTVPCYDTLGAGTIAYVVNQTSMATMLCSAEVINNVLECKKDCPLLKAIIQMEAVDEGLRSKGRAAGLQILSFAEVEQAGAEKPLAPKAPSPQDIATFSYTSGTTGNPKGAILSHRSMVSCAAGVVPHMPMKDKETVHLSYLPLPHIMERCLLVRFMFAGARIGFYQGDTLKILEDLAALRPTVFPSVPRLLNRIHDSLRAQMLGAGGEMAAAFTKAYTAKEQGLRNGLLTHDEWDPLVMNKIKAKVGLDRVEVIITGSAPIAAHVLDFLRIVFCCPVIEGYGMTETAGAATLTAIDDFEAGTVGSPCAINDIRLQDIPDMGYLRTDTVHGEGAAAEPCRGRGEVCFRGPNVFSGYYKLPDKTAEAIDEEGWMHSGDIGIWTVDGRLKIVDRKKNIFKLQQGEYVAPEKIEILNGQSTFVAQSFVYGDSLQRELVSIVVVDPEAVAAWAAKAGKKEDLAQLCQDESLNRAVLEDLKAVGQRNKLQGFEVVKAIKLEPTPWLPGGEMLTPTFKMQRSKAAKLYQTDIAELYKKILKPPSKL